MLARFSKILSFECQQGQLLTRHTNTIIVIERDKQDQGFLKRRPSIVPPSLFVANRPPHHQSASSCAPIAYPGQQAQCRFAHRERRVGRRVFEKNRSEIPQ